MSSISKSLKISELKRDLQNKQKNLLKIREVETKNLQAKKALMEADLDQAKLIIASQDVIEKLQKIAERLMEINAEEIMPLSDSMKAAFGPEIAQKFEHVASESIQKSIETVRAAKDAIDNMMLQVEGKTLPEEDSDMANYTPSIKVPDTSNEEPSSGATDDGSDESILASEEPGNPLGRELNDSLDYKVLGLVALSENKFTDLTGWALTEAKNTMPHKEFVSFGNKLLEMSGRNMVETAGWILKRKLNESTDMVELRAKAIASLIENNIKTTGKSNTSAVVNSVLKNLTENEDEVLSKFEAIYGCNPAIYSARMKKVVKEDGNIPDIVTGINPPKTTGDNSTVTSTQPEDSDNDVEDGTSNNPPESTVTSTTPAPLVQASITAPSANQSTSSVDAMRAVSGIVATDPGSVNQPLSYVIDKLNPAEQASIKKSLQNNTNMTVSQYLKKQAS